MEIFLDPSSKVIDIMWPNRGLLDLIDIELPIIQAPMAGANGSALVIAVSEAGGLGSLPCGMLNLAKIRGEIGIIRQKTSKPVNLNFFCHEPPQPDENSERTWRQLLAAYYEEFGLVKSTTVTGVNRAPFNEATCEIVEEYQPEAVSFHFGLPAHPLFDRVKAAGCSILASATTVEEACWLEGRGCDAVIAQGYEAGGHRGMFLADDIMTQVGTMALVPQIVDALNIPVIAAGGIADGRCMAAAFALGAAGAQIGTAYLFTPESLISDLHRKALGAAGDDSTAVTNLFSGGPARGLMNRIMREKGPMSDIAPAYPTAGNALAPLKAAAEVQGSDDFTSLWSGQAAGLGYETGSSDLTRQIAEDAAKLIGQT